jgi:hypothetical protein
MLNWRPLVTSYDRGYMVKGTELSQAIVPDTLSRFAIVEVRTYDADRNSDVTFRIRDAATVTDEQVRNGERPAIVFRGSLDDCLRYCEQECSPCAT